MIAAASAALDDSLASGLFASGAGSLTARPGMPIEPESRDVRAALAHAYARRVAGVPTTLRFDPDGATLVLAFRDDESARPPDPSEIYLPEHVFGDAIDVEVSGGGSWRYEPERRRLLVYRGSGSEHEVRVRPRRTHGVASPAPRASVRAH
jgi:hypothetical protein